MKKVIEVSKATKGQISVRLALLREQVETLREDLVVEDSDSQEASDTLGTILDLMIEAEGYLDADDPNQAEHLETGV
jgi:hypothetical protein